MGKQTMKLSLSFNHIKNPDGHQDSLRLKGDWLIVCLSDGKFTGYGEASHSDNDRVCKEAKKRGIQVSPHNPSGRVAGLATLHAAVVTQSISIIETTLLSTGGISLAKQNFRFTTLTIPRSPGWGLCDYP